MLVGIPIGLVAGRFGGRIDSALMWVVDIIFAFPAVVLAMLITSIPGLNLTNLLIANAVFSIASYARPTRNVTLGLR
ncbi:hypothetical protein BVG79_01245 [Ketogulonicigenium robustum]|uniref:ABC transmembrane type-1 domain-containing protein n=1 Tax=Ketogulonicigenium robustum TaxID=92947 RepID=A0A1W6NZJ2_9RHOB|nr:ABC transporter permease subunit [Ketogulonicigenium robustum]ARO14591.1 hypothetical protein BVG79_01245 [Ketogulonicigenium robustum]